MRVGTLCVCLLLTTVVATVLSPSPSVPLPIDLSATNINSVATYWFNFQTNVQLLTGSFIYIQFPAEYKSISATGCSVILNYGQTVTSRSTCAVSISYPRAQVTLAATLAVGTIFTIELTGVQNPDYPTTTGPFQVWSKVSQDSQYTSQNMMFATLAFTALLPTPSSLSAYVNTTVSGFTSTVSAPSVYTFNVNWDYWIDAGAWFRITLPTGWSKTSGIDTLCSVSNFTSAQHPPTGDFYCETSGQYVYLKGLNSSIDSTDPTKSSFALVITSVINPASARTEASVQFLIDLMELGTTNILQELKAFNPAITPGNLENLQVNTLSYLARPINGNQLVLTFRFGISHEIPTNGQIILSMSQSSSFYVDTNTALGCAIISGISDKSTGNFATCLSASQTLTISNFATVVKSSNIVLQAVVKIAATDSEILTVTTYDTNSYAIDTASVVMLRNYTDILFASYTEADITFTGGVTTTAGQVEFRMAATMQYAVGTTVYITLPPGFKTQAPTCVFGVGGPTVTLTTCNYVISTGLISLVTQSFPIPMYAPGIYAYFTIGNIEFPKVRSSYESVYEFCMTTFIVGSTIEYNHGCAQKYLGETTIAGLGMLGDAKDVGLYQVYTISFQSPVAVTYTAGTLIPQIRISFPTTDGASNPGFGLNLGVTGTPYCSMDSTSSNYLTCQVVSAAMQANGVSSTLILSYLNSISTSDTLKARTVLQSPQSAGSYDHIIEIGYLKNRIWNVIGSKTMVGVVYGTTAGTAWTPTVTMGTQIVLQPTLFTVGLPSGSAVALGSPWTINVIFPTTWDISLTSSATINSVNCANLEKMMNTYAPILRCYSDSAATQLSVAASLVLSGMKNPSSAISFTSGLQVVYAGAGVLIKNGSTATLTPITAATLTVASVVPDMTERSAKGVHYTFKFTTLNPIPAGGAVSLQFPAQYSGLMTNFQCSYLSGFAANTGSNLSCGLSSQTITISNLALTASGTAMSVQIRRLDNPSLSSLSPFFITTMSPSAYIDRTSSLTPLSVSLPTSFSSGSIYYNTLSFEPNTAGAQYADFFMSFKPQHRVPEGATVQITIPFDFVDIATAGCAVNVMISSCTAAGHYVNFVTGEDVASVTVLTVTVNQAFTIPLTSTALFGVMVSYGGTTIDQSQSDVSRTSANSFTPTPAASTMTVTSIDFYPNNQGEPATYTFSFSIPTTILSSYSLIIWFPSDFDPSINTNHAGMSCWGDPVEFVGSLLSCEVGGFRRVSVAGLLTIPAGFQFSVAIGSVMNPVSGKIGQFRFAVQNSAGQTLNYQVNSGNFAIGSGPTPMKFKMVTYANNHLRALNSLTFSFSPSSNIPSSDDQGQIFIDLPSEYPLMNIGDQTGWELPCQTWLLINDVVNATNWNDNVKCVNYNSNRVIVTGGKLYVALPTQTIKIKIDQLPGPQLGLTRRLIKVMTYDGVKEVLLDRNYGQLSYIDSFSLTLQGEVLTVNNGESISVIRGTCSNLFPITSQTPMRVDLQLTALMPRVLMARLNPTNVMTFRTSWSQIQTCVAVPVSLTPGVYNLQWSKTGDEYSLSADNQSIYAPLMVSSVAVVSGKASVQIGTISNVPAGGHSLPITISLSYSPFNELIITPTPTGTIDPGITFDPPSLQFTSGVQQLTVYIHATTTILRSSYVIQWILDGTDAEAYSQPGNSEVTITGDDDLLPIVTQARYVGTRNTVTAFLTANKPGTFYYQLELQGTPVPTASQLQQAISLNRAQFIAYYVYGPELPLSLTSLAAETSYLLFLTLEDSSGRLAPVHTLPIKTVDDYPSVKFVIDFSATASVTRDQDTISMVIEPEVARALSVTPQRISIFSIGLDPILGRRLAGSEDIDIGMYTENALVVMLANDKYMDMVSPAELATGLTVATLNSFLGRHGLNAVSISPAITLTNDNPLWSTTGNVWDVQGTSITCGGSLQGPGYLHMVVLDYNSDPPSSQQVAWGLDASNSPTRHGYAYYDGMSSFAYANYTGVQPNTRYDVYVTSTNAYPGNNKAVSETMQAYKGVLTATDDLCLGRCPLYYVSEQDSGEWIGVALLVYLGL